MKLDLHLHTTASDGSVSPEELVGLASAAGLDVIAITDHDTVAGVGRALRAARAIPLKVVPAIEVSARDGVSEYHILGYFIDPEASSIKAHERRALGGREDRMAEMVERLRRQGLQVELADVLEAAGPDRSAIARPHLARALVARGYAQSVPDAFDRLIGDDHAAYVPTSTSTAAEAIGSILDAGGIPVWAHPPLDRLHEDLPALVAAGLRGLEVYRPRATARQIRSLERSARSSGLITTGGSDWHGPERGPLVGDFHVTAELVGGLLDAAGDSLPLGEGSQ